VFRCVCVLAGPVPEYCTHPPIDWLAYPHCPLAPASSFFICPNMFSRLLSNPLVTGAVTRSARVARVARVPTAGPARPLSLMPSSVAHQQVSSSREAKRMLVYAACGLVSVCSVGTAVANRGAATHCEGKESSPTDR
jgi:hypothetical protein